MVEVDMTTLYSLLDDITFIQCLLKEKKYDRIHTTINRMNKVLLGYHIKNIAETGR